MADYVVTEAGFGADLGAKNLLTLSVVKQDLSQVNCHCCYYKSNEIPRW